MRKYYPGHVDVQSTIVSIFASLMFLSLLCSLSWQHGHADVPIAESAERIQPRQTGQFAPRFVVRSLAGEPFIFDPLTLDRPVVVVSFRGGWCPWCNMHLSELHTVIPEVQALGVDVLFLSGDRPELLYDSLADKTRDAIEGLGYQLLSDADAQAAIAFGIAFKASAKTINRRHEKGQDIVGSSMLRHGILPVPAVFVIDTDGRITFSFVEANYKVRLPPEDLLAAALDVVQ